MIIKKRKIEKIEINIDNIKKDHKELLERNKLILKTQQRFKSERDNVYTEEINKIPLKVHSKV